jgi:hypothetical protein
MMVEERNRDRRLDALADHLQDRHVRDQRHAEIALQQLADPGEELGVERLVEAERGADALELFGRRVVAGEDRGGIARASAAAGENTNSATTPITGMAARMRRSRYPSILIR